MDRSPALSSLLTVAEVAEILVCSEANVYTLIDVGELPYITIGKSKGYRIDRDDLVAFLSNRKVQRAGAKRNVTRRQLKHLRL